MKSNWRSITTVVIIAVALSLLWGRVDIDEIHRRAESVPGILAFGLMIALPLLGCPATLVNLGAGVRFGIAGGLPLVALAIVLHQIIAFLLVRWKPGMFGHLVDPIRRRLPKGSHASVTVFSALLPGIPYWMQVYAMPLIGVPLRTVLLCAVPLHTARSMIALVGGDISEHLTAGWLVALGAYAVVLMAVCAYAGRRIRRQLKKTRPRKDTPTEATSGTSLRTAMVGGGK
jgi:uncharacterized membrane protein YdjX (TVP38/TMEM64 family)